MERSNKRAGLQVLNENLCVVAKLGVGAALRNAIGMIAGFVLFTHLQPRRGWPAPSPVPSQIPTMIVFGREAQTPRRRAASFAYFSQILSDATIDLIELCSIERPHFLTQ